MLEAMELLRLKSDSLNSVITLWDWMVCHKYWPTLICVSDAPYSVSARTLGVLSSLRNTLTINFKICQRLPVYVLVGLSPYVILMSVQYNPSIFELEFPQHR